MNLLKLNMRHYCNSSSQVGSDARANATQIYWVAGSAVAHLPSLCAAANTREKFMRAALLEAKKGLGTTSRIQP